MARIEVSVFSFNRGPFLQNCVASIRAHTPWPVSVWDDDSHDPLTVRVLRELEADGVPVHQPSRKMVRHHMWGGLHGNMLAAFEKARDEGVDYLFFIQDDQQVVRPVGDEVVEHADRFFATHERTFLLHTFFLKQVYFRHDQTRMNLDASRLAYFRGQTGPGNAFYSDTGIFSVARFWQLCGQRLTGGEPAYERWCAQHDLKMGFYVHPFAMWNPYPTAWRKQSRPLFERAIEAISGAGFHPFRPMAPDAQARLLNRDLAELPVAEHYLDAPTSPSRTCFSTEGGESNLLCRGGWRKGLGMGLLQYKRLRKRLKERAAARPSPAQSQS